MRHDLGSGQTLVENLIKVRFELDASDWHGHGSETLWAEPVVSLPGQTACLESGSNSFRRVPQKWGKRGDAASESVDLIRSYAASGIDGFGRSGRVM